MEESRHTGDTEEEHGCDGGAEAYDGCPDMSERRVGVLDFRKVAGSQHWGEDRYAQCSGAVAWALGLVLESWGQYFVKTTAMGTTTVCQWRSRRCARILQGDISVYCSRPEELEVTVHRLECEKDVLQGNLMAGERKGEMLQGVKKECHRAKEELQDQLTASEGEQQSQHLVYKHAMEEEEAPLGDEGYSCERTKVQEEAGDRLWVFTSCVKAIYVLQVRVQKIERLAHHNDVWYGRIPACW